MRGHYTCSHCPLQVRITRRGNSFKLTLFLAERAQKLQRNRMKWESGGRGMVQLAARNYVGNYLGVGCRQAGRQGAGSGQVGGNVRAAVRVKAKKGTCSMCARTRSTVACV